MSHYVECVCADNESLFVNTLLFRHSQPVISRMLGIAEGFAAPQLDEFDRLTFLKNFGICRDDFAQCQAFLSSGHVTNVGTLVRTFSIFGGCPALDTYIVKQREKVLLDETKRLNNPIHPGEDILGLYRFELHLPEWQHADDWSVSMKAGPYVWWRKRIKRI